MKAAVLSFSKNGSLLALKVEDILGRNDISALSYTMEKFATENTGSIKGSITSFTGTLFNEVDLLVFIGATGIAVRAIAPYIKSKVTDPAVICLDDAGRFAISLLSGHIGGGNKLTDMLAKQLGAVAVITTATDINGRFSVDSFATEKGYKIESLKIAKDISAEILERDIPIYCDTRITGVLPKGLVAYMSDKESSKFKLGISVSAKKKKPFESTLLLIPRVLSVGIGCRRGTTKEQIAVAINNAFVAASLDTRAIKSISSIDVKKDEVGLLEYCSEKNILPIFYTADELLEVKGEFSSSEFVKSTVGVDNVCERSAVIDGGKLIVNKTALDGVTVAIAIEDWGVSFE